MSSIPINKEQTGIRFAFQKYIKFIDEIISRGNGITLFEIYDITNNNEDIDIKDNKVKIFLTEFFGRSIQFCESDKQNQSPMVFSSSLDITDLVKIVIGKVFICIYLRLRQPKSGRDPTW